MVKGTSVDKFFLVVEKGWKTWFLALVGLTRVKDTSVRKKVAKKDQQGEANSISFGTIFDQNSIPKLFKKYPLLVCQRGAKMEPTSMPKLIKNQCQKVVAKKIMNIIKIHVFLYGKTLQLHCKNNGF